MTTNPAARNYNAFRLFTRTSKYSERVLVHCIIGINYDSNEMSQGDIVIMKDTMQYELKT